MNDSEWQTYLALEQAGPRPGPHEARDGMLPPWGNGEVSAPWPERRNAQVRALHALLGKRRSADGLWHPLDVAALHQVLSLALGRPALGAPFRPYPTSGGCDELGILVAARRVEGLSEGAYWATTDESGALPYAAPLDERYLAFESSVTPFLEHPPTPPPAALLLIMADWRRLCSRYVNCVLASALWDAGCLLQTLHLAAAAIEIHARPCACIQPRLVEAWLQLDCRSVGQVGLIALGGRPASVP